MDRFTFSAPPLAWSDVKDVAGWLFCAAWLWFVFVPYVRANWNHRGGDD